jgi:lysophospholipase
MKLTGSKLFTQCFVCIALLSAPAFAISEKDYAKSFDSIIMPFYASAGVSGEFSGVGGIKISYRKFEVPDEKGAIVFSPGRGESYLTYPELEYDLVQAGFSVYVIDHRSQGYSGRIARDTQIVTVESYDNYVTDFTTFVDTVVNSEFHAHRYLLTNSMGGPIGALYLAKHPGTFERAVLSVPMFEIDTHGIPEPLGLELAKLETSIGHGDRFAKLGGEKPYDFNADKDCGSSDGHAVRRCEIANLVRANPATASGGSSYRWVVQSLETTRRIRKGLGTQIKIPVLIFQAGRDQIVLPGGENGFCAQAPSCTMIKFPSASHEILTERDEIRTPAVRSIIEFLGR